MPVGTKKEVPGSSALGTADIPVTKPRNAVQDELRELRGLLLDPERAEIAELRRRLDDPAVRAEETSAIIAEAIRLRPHPDKNLISALSPPFEEAFKTSVQKNPDQLVDAISPVMGPAIRKSISDALQRMVQSLQQTLDYSLSPKSMKWRIEAMRTGKSFAEIVMLHTLLYRVEQVFLIHRQTGHVLEHLMAGGEKGRDPDMVSGMLTAIQDFVRDSLGAGEGEALDNLRVGEMTVWIEQGTKGAVAAVIRGNAPQDLRAKFQDVLEQIHREMGPALAAFNGDPSKFGACQSLLETCLVEERRSNPANVEPRKKKPKRKPMPKLLKAVITLGILCVGVFGVRWYLHVRQERARWALFLQELKSQPGIVVISAEQRDGGYFLYGLRDELAPDPVESAKKLGITPVSGNWEPYQSMTSSLVLRRAEHVLNPPSSVKLSLSNSVLRATGTAPATWIEAFRRLAVVLPGIHAVDETDLRTADWNRP